MKQCIAITELLRRTVIVDTKEVGADSLEIAIECVKKAYNAQKIVLDADDIISESVYFCEADWVDKDEIQKKDADFTL